eukprot:m.61240 g.61240  ORF g.61240 m.61240 type:complete len:720 (+) comp22953_c0_seq1:208-2367(+)
MEPTDQAYEMEDTAALLEGEFIQPHHAWRVQTPEDSVNNESSSINDTNQSYEPNTPDRLVHGLSRRPSSWSDWRNRIVSPNRRSLSYEEQLTMSPFEKFWTYRRFPAKFLLHVLVLTVSTTFVILNNNQFERFIAANEQSFKGALQHDENVDEFGRTQIQSVDGLFDHMRTSATSYFMYTNNTIGDVQIDVNYKITVEYWNGTTNIYKGTATSPGWWILGEPAGKAIEAKRNATNALKLVQTQFQFENQLLADPTSVNGPYQSTKFSWTCTGNYDFTNDALTVFLLQVKYRRAGMIHVLVTLDGLTIFFCIASTLLSLKALRKAYRVFAYARTKLIKPRTTQRQRAMLRWEQLNWKDKLAFFNLWHLVSIVGDIGLIIASALALNTTLSNNERGKHDVTAEVAFRSIGILMKWMASLKYMEHYIEFYMLIVAVRASFGRVMKFVLMVTPIYLGYTFVGVLCFASHQPYFDSVSNSARTLFALLHGDSILEIYEQICTNNDWGYCFVGQLYLYTFCLIFIIIILNTFIFIIETGYDKAEQSTLGKNMPVELDHKRLKRVLDAADAVSVQQMTDISREGSGSLQAPSPEPSRPTLKDLEVHEHQIKNPDTQSSLSTIDVERIISKTITQVLQRKNAIETNEVISQNQTTQIDNERIEKIKEKARADALEMCAAMRNELETEYKSEIMRLSNIIERQKVEIEISNNGAKALAQELATLKQDE